MQKVVKEIEKKDKIRFRIPQKSAGLCIAAHCYEMGSGKVWEVHLRISPCASWRLLRVVVARFADVSTIIGRTKVIYFGFQLFDFSIDGERI